MESESFENWGLNLEVLITRNFFFFPKPNGNAPVFVFEFGLPLRIERKPGVCETMLLLALIILMLMWLCFSLEGFGFCVG